MKASFLTQSYSFLSNRNPLDILKEPLAKGEITDEEYERLKGKLM